MGVVVNQLEHLDGTPADVPRGNGDASGGGSTTVAAIEARMRQMMRREASRRARLWAD